MARAALRQPLLQPLSQRRAEVADRHLLLRAVVAEQLPGGLVDQAHALVLAGDDDAGVHLFDDVAVELRQIGEILSASPRQLFACQRLARHAGGENRHGEEDRALNARLRQREQLMPPLEDGEPRLDEDGQCREGGVERRHVARQQQAGAGDARHHQQADAAFQPGAGVHHDRKGDDVDDDLGADQMAKRHVRQEHHRRQQQVDDEQAFRGEQEEALVAGRLAEGQGAEGVQQQQRQRDADAIEQKQLERVPGVAFAAVRAAGVNQPRVRFDGRVVLFRSILDG